MCLSGSWWVEAEELEDHQRLGLFWSCVGLADSIMPFESIKTMCVRWLTNKCDGRRSQLALVPSCSFVKSNNSAMSREDGKAWLGRGNLVLRSRCLHVIPCPSIGSCNEQGQHSLSILHFLWPTGPTGAQFSQQLQSAAFFANSDSDQEKSLIRIWSFAVARFVETWIIPTGGIQIALHGHAQIGLRCRRHWDWCKATALQSLATLCRCHFATMGNASPSPLNCTNVSCLPEVLQRKFHRASLWRSNACQAHGRLRSNLDNDRWETQTEKYYTYL